MRSITGIGILVLLTGYLQPVIPSLCLKVASVS